ncbi:MAG: ketopantoate reductase family protein [Microthrixaceae bacterium]
MKIAIVGTGAMGAIYAGLLADAGNEVWAVDTWDEHLEVIAGRGLSVSGASGDRVVKGIHVASTPAEVGPADLWVIATKAADVDAVTGPIAALLRPDDVVMPFQNGIGAGERVAAVIPEAQIVIGIAEGFGSSIPEPGAVHHNGMRLIRIGDMGGGLTDRALGLEELWRDAGFNARAFADVEVMVWEKFICNVTCSAPTAAFDMTVGEVMGNPDTRAVALGCTLEAHRLAVARGVDLPFEDPIAYVTDFAASIPDASPSMRLDHLARRRSEVDVINGAVVDMSREAGFDAPYNETLCAVLRAREATFATGA